MNTSSGRVNLKRLPRRAVGLKKAAWVFNSDIGEQMTENYLSVRWSPFSLLSSKSGS